ncbi:MAG: hypothetical protein R3B60_00295 [Candidatus Paceibacterota bacterium]
MNRNKFLLLLFLALMLFLSGCASNIYTKKSSTETDSARLETVTNRTHLNGKVVTLVVADWRGIDPVTGENLGGVNPETGEQLSGNWKRTVHILESDSILDRAILAVLGGTGAAAIQGHFFREAMAAKACRGFNCGLFNVSNPMAQSGSMSESITEMSNTMGSGGQILWAK